jgi:hypothetical protein
MASPMQKKAAVELMVDMRLCKIGRACRALGVARSTLDSKREESARKLAGEGTVEEVSRAWPCLDYEKMTSILRRE